MKHIGQGVRVNLIGHRFGAQIVIARTTRPENYKRHGAFWIVRCELCNKQRRVETRTLRVSKGRGCKSCSQRGSLGEAAFVSLFGRYKASAKTRGLEWGLTRDEFKSIISSPCYFTGKLPSQRSVTQTGDLYIFNGIDRLNPSIGYVTGNCVPCCKEVNYAKQSMTLEAFVELCSQVASRFADRALGKIQKENDN